MPAGRTHFNNDWLDCKDKQGFRIHQWCEPNVDEKHRPKVFCKLCNKFIRCDNQGLSQLLQHADGNFHKNLAKDILGGTQMTINLGLGDSQGSTPSSATKSRICCTSSKNQATKAELIWTMKVVGSKFCYASCDGISGTFQAMFPEGYPQDFSLSSSKVSYLVSEAVGPYFHKLVTSDVVNSGSFYTLQYDETTNKQAMKQLDIIIRFWSSSLGEVKVHHLRTFLMGKATAIKLSDKIVSAIDDSCIPLDKLLMLGSDGPNVNKSVWAIINKKLLDLETRSTGLLDFGTCNLHVVFNAFKKGLDAYGKNISELNIDLYQWFKLSPARKEEYGTIQESRGAKRQVFIKHVECKWITFLPAMERILQEWGNLIYYFLTFLPKEQPKVEINARYIRIKNCLKSKELLVQMNFLKSVNLCFHRFLTFFQREEPLIHLLYDELSLLLKKVMSRFIKHEVLADKTITQLTEVNVKLQENQLNCELIEIGNDARKSLITIDQSQRKLILMKMRNFLEICTKHLQKKLPLSKGLLCDFRCFSPNNRTKTWTQKSIKSIATDLPLDLSIDDLCDEWRMYQFEKVPDEMFMDKESTPANPVYKRVDHYWNEILHIKSESGQLKYPELTKVVKACLIISHGNSDVERGFSESGGSITSERVKLWEESVNAIRNTTDGLKCFRNKPEAVPMTKEFLTLGQKAHSCYVRRLEEEKKLKIKKKLEEEQKKAEETERTAIQESLTKKSKELQNSEKNISEQEDSQYMEMDVGSSILKEANEKLKTALKEKTCRKLQLPKQCLKLLTQIEAAKSSLEKTRIQQQTVQKRKQSLLDNFLSPGGKAKSV